MLNISVLKQTFLIGIWKKWIFEKTLLNNKSFSQLKLPLTLFFPKNGETPTSLVVPHIMTGWKTSKGHLCALNNKGLRGSVNKGYMHYLIVLHYLPFCMCMQYIHAEYILHILWMYSLYCPVMAMKKWYIWHCGKKVYIISVEYFIYLSYGIFCYVHAINILHKHIFRHLWAKAPSQQCFFCLLFLHTFNIKKSY